MDERGAVVIGCVVLIFHRVSEDQMEGGGKLGIEQRSVRAELVDHVFMAIADHRYRGRLDIVRASSGRDTSIFPADPMVRPMARVRAKFRA